MFSKINVKFSGVNSNSASGDIDSTRNNISYASAKACQDAVEYRAGKMEVDHLWGISRFQYDFSPDFDKWNSYNIMLDDGMRDTGCLVLNYINNSTFRLTAEKGLCPLTEDGNKFSFYRREYEEIGRYGDETPTVVKGEWEPVAIDITSGRIRDFNITNGRSYQYIMYPNEGAQMQQYANANMEDGTAGKTGSPVKVRWQDWSICELEPITVNANAPILKKSYKVDLDNIWLFKYSLETGSQTQNISKNEYKTLGQYSRFGYGKANSLSGEVSCYLGSEIVPYTKDRYLERLWKGIDNPGLLSTNQKVDMLNKWRKLVFSKNPKLLRDMKGQGWIVQVISGSNTPKNFYKNQPDTISFSWKQIGDLDGCIIYGDGDTISKAGDPSSIWYPWSKISEDKQDN